MDDNLKKIRLMLEISDKFIKIMLENNKYMNNLKKFIGILA